MQMIKGIYCAMITPLDEQENIDQEAAQKTALRLVDEGVDGLLLLGSTGEGIALRQTAKADLIRAVRSGVGNSVPVVAGCGATSTCLAIDNVYAAAEAGADAVIITPPCFYPFDADALYVYYTEIAKESPVPVYLYNISRYAGVRIPVETVRRLKDNPKIQGIKESDRDLQYVRELLDATSDRPDFCVMQGSERVFVQSFDMGCPAGVTVVGNVDVKPVVSLYRAWKSGNRKEADRLQALLLDYVRVITILGMFPQELKICMKGMGLLNSDRMTSPFPQVTDGQRETVLDALEQLRENNH
ncbi:MAG: dihydrodipicolinate synthase family protein [Clostridia bacterium]|nr:dihydrodipicolinate synthase family protein [Clostridia bacterium]